MNGILLVNKPVGITSRDVVNQVGKILKTKKIGHTGTLDPLASGVLVLCVGKATKLVELLTATEKEYIAEITFGQETDTLDSTGNLLREEKCTVCEEQIKNCLKGFVGTYEQEVPLYSAVHINGKKLYEYARNGEKMKLPSRPVTIYELELLEQKSANQIQIRALVSKGTYIRSLVRDIAHQLNTIGVMSALKRTKQGKYPLEACYTLEQIQNGNYSFISMKEALQDYSSMIVDEKLAHKIQNGQLLEKENFCAPILFLNSKEEPLALYRTYEKDERYLKPWKMF